MMQIIDIIDVGCFSKQHVRFPLDLTYAHIFAGNYGSSTRAVLEKTIISKQE